VAIANRILAKSSPEIELIFTMFRRETMGWRPYRSNLFFSRKASVLCAVFDFPEGVKLMTDGSDIDAAK